MTLIAVLVKMKNDQVTVSQLRTWWQNMESTYNLQKEDVVEDTDFSLVQADTDPSVSPPGAPYYQFTFRYNPGTFSASQIRTYLQNHAPSHAAWGGVWYHDCTHDQPNTAACPPWQSFYTWGTLPAGVAP